MPARSLSSVCCRGERGREEERERRMGKVRRVVECVCA